mgnify:FL=1
MKFLMLGLEISKFNLKPFIIDASQIVSVVEHKVDDKECLKIKLKDIEDICYCTHFYDEPAFSRISSIHAFYDMLKELS